MEATVSQIAHQTTAQNRLRSFLSFAFFLLAVLCFGTVGAEAQQDVGFVLGTITDPSAGVVVGAKVHIVNESTGIAQDLVTNESGFYQSQPLQPGSYTVTVMMNGYASASERSLVVDAASHVTANVKLEVGSVTTTVNIESTPPALDTVDAQIGNTVDTRAVQELPVNGRSVLALATLSPGVESAVGATSQGFTNRGTQGLCDSYLGRCPGGQ